MTDNNQKLRALVLATLMVTSIMAGTIGIAGMAAAANTAGTAGITANPSDPGITSTHTAQLNIESGDAVVSSSLNGFEVDYSVDGNFDGSISNVGPSDVGPAGVSTNGDGTIEQSLTPSSVSASNNGETLTFTFGGSYTLSAGDRIIVKFNDAQNPSEGTFDVELTANPQSGQSSATGTLNIVGSNQAVLYDVDDDNVNDEDSTGNPLGVDTANDEIYAAIPVTAIDPGQDNVTAVHNFNGNAKQLTTSQTFMTGGTPYYFVSFSAAKDADSDVDFLVNGKDYDTEDYDTMDYEVRVSPDEVLFNGTTTIDGTIYKGPGVIADGQEFEYALNFDDDDNTPGDQLVTTVSDTNNGQFSITAEFDTYDNSFLRDYEDDGDDATLGPNYLVEIDDTNTDSGTINNVVGQAKVDTRLDVSASASNAVYDQSGQVSGTAVDADETDIDGYDVTFLEPDADVRKTTSTADSQFGFTVVYEDAGEWNVATNEGGLIRYETVTVAPQQANLELTSDGDNQAGFEQTYTLNVTDADGNAIDTDADNSGNAEGYVNVTGEFSSASGASVVHGPVDSDSDSAYEFFHVATDGDGEVTFTATPQGSAVTATLENPVDSTLSPPDGVAYVVGSNDVLAGGLEVETDAADTPLSPDYVGSATLPVGTANPVNIVDSAVQDPQTRNAPDAVTDNPPAYETLGEAGAVNDPFEVNVVPLAQTTGTGNGARFDGGPNDNESRLGYDANLDEEGITAYRVQFELVDQSGADIQPSDVESITIEGAGINAVWDVDTGSFGGDGLLDVRYADVDGDGDREYSHLVRPTSVDDPDENVTVTVNVTGEAPVTLSAPATGLFIDQFQVDGETVDAVSANQDINVSSQVKNPATDPVFVNNGRVRLSQEQNTNPSTTQVVQLNETDARTASVNNGLYSFDNVQVGPRGLDDDGDAIGERTADLTFTAYQYEDVDPNQQIEQQEVNNATVETLGLEPDRSLQVEYDAENTTVSSGSAAYSGFDNGTFTLTKGVEYEQIAFDLTDEDGTPVNLTEGLRGERIGSLNDLTDPGATDSGALVTLTSDSGGEIYVEFDTSQSRPSDGYYVISDIKQSTLDQFDTDGDGSIDFVRLLAPSDGTGLNNGDDFVFDTFANDEETDYTLNIETPDRNRTTAPDTGTFTAAQAQIEYEVVGVAGGNVPNSIQDTDGNDALFDEPDYSRDQSAAFNYSRQDVIETASVADSRAYRYNATVTDALGTPLNATEFGEVRVDFEGYSDRVLGGPSDVGQFRMVDGPDVDATVGTGHDTEAQNQNGTFQFDTEKGRYGKTGDDGILTATFDIEAQDDTSVAPFGDSGISKDVARNPVVEVYDENGGELPRAEDTDNLILAQRVENRLRVEAFPADEDDFVLPDGQLFSFVGPTAENQVRTTTEDVGSFANTQLSAEGYDDGQIGFVRLTPTGTGDGIITVTDGGAIVRNTTGDPVDFDVQRSNRELVLDAPADVETGDSVTLSFTDQRTGAPVDTVTVIVESPDGDTTTVLTDANGTATVNSSFIDEPGESQIDTRRAGYAPLTDSFEVSGAAGPQVDLTSATLDPNDVSDNQTVTHTLTLDISNVSDDGNTDTVTVQFPSAVDDVAFNSATVTDADGNTVALTGAGVSGNLVTFSVSPDSSAETRDLTAEVSVDVTFPDVSSNTTADISVAVSDSANGQDTGSVAVTIRDGTTGDGGVVAEYDTTGEGVINNQELLGALADYQDGVSDSDLLTLLAAYEADA